MKKLLAPRFLLSALLVCLIAGWCVTGISGCNGFALPPIPISIPIVVDAHVVAADEDDGTVEVLLTIFCDLFSEEELDAMLVAAGGEVIANLVSIPSVELASVTVEATQGDFNDFTSASLRLVGGNPMPLGAASNAGGLGATFEMTQATPVDLINDLGDGECGIPTLTLTGAKPGDDITFNATANVLVYTRLTF